MYNYRLELNVAVMIIFSINYIFPVCADGRSRLYVHRDPWLGKEVVLAVQRLGVTERVRVRWAFMTSYVHPFGSLI